MLTDIYLESVKKQELIESILSLYNKMIIKHSLQKDFYKKSDNYNPLETILKMLNNYFYNKADFYKFNTIYNKIKTKSLTKSSLVKYIIPLIDIDKYNNIIYTFKKIESGFDNLIQKIYSKNLNS